MNKLDILIKKYPDEVNEVISKLYNDKFPRKDKKRIFKFKVLGKEYNSDVFTRNYVDFIKDISKIHTYEMFKNTNIKSYISKSDDNMKQSHKIGDGFFVTSYSSTNLKISHIKDICEFLNITLTEII